MQDRALDTDRVVRAYLAAKRQVVEAGFADEIAWQASARTKPLTTRTFVGEAAWVILNSGMSERVVRSLFPALARAYYDFDARDIAINASTVRCDALSIFGHEGKVDAIVSVGRLANDLGADGLSSALQEPQTFLCSLPYVGPVTWRHLAKNLGLPVAKADRHLVRLASVLKRESVDGLCDEIAHWVGDPVPVVDVVLWRWSVLNRGAAAASWSPAEAPIRLARQALAGLPG